MREWAEVCFAADDADDGLRRGRARGRGHVCKRDGPNAADWGTRLFGAQAAARHYFDVDAQALSPAQAAQLAVLLPRPSYYDVRGTTEYVEQRTLWIQKQLPLVRIPPS